MFSDVWHQHLAQLNAAAAGETLLKHSFFLLQLYRYLLQQQFLKLARSTQADRLKSRYPVVCFVKNFSSHSILHSCIWVYAV